MSFNKFHESLKQKRRWQRATRHVREAINMQATDIYEFIFLGITKRFPSHQWQSVGDLTIFDGGRTARLLLHKAVVCMAAAKLSFLQMPFLPLHLRNRFWSFFRPGLQLGCAGSFCNCRRQVLHRKGRKISLHRIMHRFCRFWQRCTQLQTRFSFPKKTQKKSCDFSDIGTGCSQEQRFPKTNMLLCMSWWHVVMSSNRSSSASQTNELSKKVKTIQGI